MKVTTQIKRNINLEMIEERLNVEFSDRVRSRVVIRLQETTFSDIVAHSLTTELEDDLSPYFDVVVERVSGIEDNFEADLDLNTFSLSVKAGEHYELTIGNSRSGLLSTPVHDHTLASVVSHIVHSLLLPDVSENYKMIKTKYSPEYQLSFNLLNADPSSNSIRDWEFSKMQEAYLNQIIEKLSPVADFNIESQVLYYSSLSMDPIFEPEDNYYYFTKEMLPYFIDQNTWNIEFTAFSETEYLNFITYIPTSETHPMFIKTDKVNKNAFIIPQWGGVYIKNIGSEGTVLDVNDLHEPIEIFTSHLRSLLGITPHEAIIRNIRKQIKDININIIPSIYDGVSDWELDKLLRERILEANENSRKTLFQFIQLVKELSNIPVDEEIEDLVMNAIQYLEDSERYVKEKNLLSAHQMGKLAYKASEKAFFDPDMVGMLYFPIEHNYAIHVPLFLPLLFPLFSGFSTEGPKLFKKIKKLF
eukprot:TRINITY_DN7058_c0_g1_i1.p1 TRINITY_DN7058_c0_g1~~TRINITY_DN7058_c0_g1_i1.p1  ORF type:complete len:494 (+),score=93.36 TRINITY_DN7058_c0_g1_i1:61-1482(+)